LTNVLQHTSYNFPQGPFAHRPSFPGDPNIDPQLLQDDSRDPRAIKLRTLKSADKVAGVRQTNKKSKKCARSSDSDCDSDRAALPPPPKQRGRPKGSSNFTATDLKKLLKLTEQHLPLAQKGWKEVVSDFNEWAIEADRSERDAKALKAKFKQVRCVLSSFIVFSLV
jgi:hypothetical protein